MKTVLIAVAVIIVIASSSFAQTSISEIQNIEAEELGYRIVASEETSEFVRFTEPGSQIYGEVYDEGNLIDLIFGGEVYTYRATKHKIYPIYEYSEWMSRDSSYVIYNPKIIRDYKYYGPNGQILK